MNNVVVNNPNNQHQQNIPININQNPQEILDQGDQKEHNFYWKCSCWFFQILDWALLVLAIIMGCLGSKYSLHLIIVFIIVHLIYILIEICSPTSKYLCHKNSGNGMYEDMKRYFRTPPTIQFYGESFHYERFVSVTYDKYGNRHEETRQEKIITHTETFHMPYYSERDISGLFYLNCDKDKVNKKAYIKLKLKEEINFADTISYMDYQQQKDNFYARNQYRDIYFEFNEKRFIPGLINHNLIKLGNSEPFLSNYFFFMLSNILALSEIYKLYFDSLCIFQRFKIRKLISTRYDLNQPQYTEKYERFNPQINLLIQVFKYEPQDFNYLNNNYQVDLPTEEEIEQAQKYNDKIPNYQISSENGKLPPGVIMDNPNYSNYMSKEVKQQFDPKGINPNINGNINNNIPSNVNPNMNNNIPTKPDININQRVNIDNKFEINNNDITQANPNQNEGDFTDRPFASNKLEQGQGVAFQPPHEKNF